MEVGNWGGRATGRVAPECCAKLSGWNRTEAARAQDECARLTFARIWTTLATGEIRSKDAAADWALARLPPEHRPVLDHAKQLYLTRRYTEETWSDELTARVRPHVDAVLAEIGPLTAR